MGGLFVIILDNQIIPDNQICGSIILFASILCVYGIYTSIKQVKSGEKYDFYYWFGLWWLGVLASNVLLGVALIFSILSLVEIGAYISATSFGVTAVFWVGCGDVLKRESVDPLKMGVTIALGAVGVTLLYCEPIDFWLGWVLIYSQQSIPAIFILICSVELKQKAPSSLRTLANRFLIGVTFNFSSYWVSFLLPLISPNLQILGLSLNLIGLFLMVSAYGREPKLLFVLPFKALRLTVLDTRSGIAMFSHTWNEGKDLADDHLFSGYLTGINGVIQESLRRGHVQEIRSTDAVIMVSYDPQYPVAYVLITTRPSQSLRDRLQIFANQFSEKYLSKRFNSSDMGQFAGATALITASFPHVPVYD